MQFVKISLLNILSSITFQSTHIAASPRLMFCIFEYQCKALINYFESSFSFCNLTYKLSNYLIFIPIIFL
uniref:Uncharacterized protein n=1 Tax=Meloidogyne enterolobii TaxID=390850 RepID=A0A6V7TWX3_MELEN|nr:unnamed protein product [Meloidogyne enterolobii]